MRLAVCDEQWLFASVLASALALQGHEVVATTVAPERLLDEAARLHPDLCLLDVAAGPPSYVEVAERMRELEPAPAVILLTDSCLDHIWDAYDRGLLDGLVNKASPFPALVRAISRVAAGERVAEGWPTTAERRSGARVVDALTTRELEVLRLVVQGHSTQAMAERLGVSRHTIRTHVQQVLRKLDVHGRGKVARAAAAAGLVDVTGMTGSERPGPH